MSRGFIANTAIKKDVAELIEKYGARLTLDAIAEYCRLALGLNVWARQIEHAARILPKPDSVDLRAAGKKAS